MDNIKEKIEDNIINWITINAGGRLVVFKPENSNNDLIVEKRGDYKKMTVALNIYGKRAIDDGDFDKENFKPESNFYLIFVHFDIVKQDIEENILIVPSMDFKKIMNEEKFSQDLLGLRQLVPSSSKFLVNKKNISNFLLEKFGK
jgi:hypothetical protein